MPNNQVAVHTPRGCTQVGDATLQSGTTTSTDCSSSSGCLVRENQQYSYGKGFAANGGGVYALLIDISGISVWFFPVCHTLLLLFFFFDFTLPQRPSVPAVIQQATTSSIMDTATWGIPTAWYSNSTCDIETHFPPQVLELLTTLCGVWYVKRKSLCLAST